jgi:hypothetical protein
MTTHNSMHAHAPAGATQLLNCKTSNCEAPLHKQGTVSISNFFKPSQQELLEPSLSIILIALFWIMKTFLIGEDEHQKIIP